MKKPKMIIFDYGQTLLDINSYDPVNGTREVLKQSCNNPNNITAEEVQSLAIELNNEIGRFGVDLEKQNPLEVHNYAFQHYLYEYFGIEIRKSSNEVERIFEDAAFKYNKTKNIDEFLNFLNSINIRTAVISNISFSGDTLKERINRYIPTNKFEFIIASSEYVFRKPHKRIFQLGLIKAALDAEDVWYCGDNAVFDIDGAANSGIFPVWYKGALEKWNKNVPKVKCLEINDWKELMEILKGEQYV